MIKMHDFVMMMQAVIEHSQLTDTARDIVMVTGLPKSGKSTLIEYLSNNSVDFEKAYTPAQAPVIKFGLASYVCECPTTHPMFFRMSLAFLEKIRFMLVTLNVASIDNAESSKSYTDYINQIEKIIGPIKDIDYARIILTNRYPLNDERWNAVPHDFYDRFISNSDAYVYEDISEKKKLQHLLRYTASIDSSTLQFNENDEERKQFESDFLLFIKEETPKLIANPEKSVLWKLSAAICNIMKKGGRFQAINSELLDAAEMFEEQYHLLTTTLREAVYQSKTDALSILIKNDIDVNQKYIARTIFEDLKANEVTALYEAALFHRKYNPKDEHIRLLIQAGANAYECIDGNYIDTEGQNKTYTTSPLETAIDNGHETELKAFLECGVDVNRSVHGETGQTYFSLKLKTISSMLGIPMHFEYNRSEYLNTLKLMLSYHADVNHIDPKGVSALMYAATLGDEELMSDFIARGGLKTLHHLDEKGLSVLMYANSIPVARQLMSHGAKMTEEMFNKGRHGLPLEMRDFFQKPFICKNMSEYIDNIHHLLMNQDYVSNSAAGVFLVVGMSESGKSKVVEFITDERGFSVHDHERTKYLETSYNRFTGWVWECPAPNNLPNHYAHMSTRLVSAISTHIRGVIVVIDVRTLAKDSFIKDYQSLISSVFVEHLFNDVDHHKSIMLAITHSDTLTESFINEVPAENVEFYTYVKNKYKHFMIDSNGQYDRRGDVVAMLQHMEPVTKQNLAIRINDSHRQKFEHDLLIYLRAATTEVIEYRQKNSIFNKALYFCEWMSDNGVLQAHNPELKKALKDFFEQYHLNTTTLYDAMGYESSNVLEVLIKNGVDVNEVYKDFKNDKTTALLDNVWKQSHQHLRLLLQAGADPYARLMRKGPNDTRFIVTPFQLVLCNYQHHQIAHYVEFGADVNSQYIDEVGVTYASAFFGSELKYMTFLKGVVETAEALLKHGADVNHINPDGVSVLMYVAQSGNTALVKQFLAKKAIKTIHHLDKRGKNVLCYAGSADVARLLMVFGATMNEGMFKKCEASLPRHSEALSVYKAYLEQQASKASVVIEVMRPSAIAATAVNDQPKNECKIM